MAWKKADPGFPPEIDPSELVHQVTFLEQKTVDDISGKAPVWIVGNPPLKVWAKIEPIRAIDVIRGGQEVGQVRVLVTVRYRREIQANMRLQTHTGSMYVIEAMQSPQGMASSAADLLVLTCLAIAPNQ